MKRRFISLMALAMATTIAISGCASSSTPAPAPAQPAAPKVLTIAVPTDLERLDPHLVSSSPSFTVMEHVVETLFFMSPQGEIKPLLAESFAAAGDGLSATVKLRAGVKYSDGVAFDANVVKANFDRLMNPATKARYLSLINTVKEVKVVDPLTVQLVLSRPYAPLYAHLTHGGAAMMHPAQAASTAELTVNPIGTGPFILKEWKKDEVAVLTKNANYWGAKAKVDEVRFKVVKEDGPRLIEVLSGTADVAKNVPPSEVARLKADANITINTTPGTRTIYVTFNTNRPLFQNPKVRQAFNYAIDQDQIVASIFNGLARVSDAPIPPPIFGYAQQTPYKRDVAKAKALLAEAGIAPGTKVQFYHPIARYPQDERVAQVVAAQLKEIGIEAELKGFSIGDLAAQLQKVKGQETWDMGMIGWGIGTGDSDYGLYFLFHSSQFPTGSANSNYGFYKNDAVDKALDDARSEFDVAKRRALYQGAIKNIWDDAPWIFLYSEVQLTAVRKNVSDFVVMASERLMAHQADKK